MKRSNSPTPAPTLAAKPATTPADTDGKPPIAGVSPHNQTERTAIGSQESTRSTSLTSSTSSDESTVWLLDGFNVLHAALFTNRDRTSWWAEEHRERLIATVRRFSSDLAANLAAEIWIAFDGKREDEPDARRLRTTGGIPIYIVFAPSADDWLVRHVRSSSAPEAINVVTRDRRVGGRVRHKGASVVAPDHFLSLCRDP